jgi:hypothetical protein
LPYSGTLGALLKHARLFDRQMNLFRFNILNLTAHRRRIDIQAAQNIGRGVDANRRPVSLK